MDTSDISTSGDADASLFVSYGSVKVKVVEAVDVLDILESSTKNKKKATSTVKYSVFASIGVHEKGHIAKRFDTRSQTYHANSVNIDEEFLFDVCSTNTLAVSMYAFPKFSYGGMFESGDVSPTCVGMLSLPVFRLEDGVTVSQWYQMRSPKDEGLRCAVKLEIVFNKDSMQVLDTFGSFNEKDPTHATTGSTTAGNSGKGGDADVSLDDGNAAEGEASKALDDLKLEDEGVLDKKDKDDDIKDIESCLHQPLTSGLVDYCLILGPLNIPSAEGDDGDSATSDADARSVGSSEMKGVERLRSSGSAAGAEEDDNSVFIWERFPEADHEDAPLPSKIEWFACPEGCRIVMSANRPESYLTSFILSTSAGVVEQFGVCLTFFISALCFKGPSTGENDDSDNDLMNRQSLWVDGDGGDGMRSSIAEKKSSKRKGEGGGGGGGKTNLRWWESPIDTEIEKIYNYVPKEAFDSLRSTGTQRKWVAVTVAMITHWPFIQPLSYTLRHAYLTEILPKVDKWEFDNFINPNPRKGVGRRGIRRPHEVGLQSLSLGFSQLLIKLCMEYPIPIPGLFHLNVKFRNLNYGPLGADYFGKPLPDYEGQESVEFRLSLQQGAPYCPYPLETLLYQLGPRLIVDTLLCAMFENKILFHSSDLAVLPAICEGLRTLLYPFRWSHVYLPVVPSQLLDLMEAPVPFMLGTHSSWLPLIPLECLRDVVIVDCDAAVIDVGLVKVPHFPVDIDRWLMLGMKMLLSPLTGAEDYAFVSRDILNLRPLISLEKQDISETAIMLQLLFFDTMVNLLRDVPNCLFFLTPTSPVFNRPLYLDEYALPEYRAFLEAITDTNAFHQVIDDLYSPELAFFLEGVRVIDDMEGSGDPMRDSIAGNGNGLSGNNTPPKARMGGGHVHNHPHGFNGDEPGYGPRPSLTGHGHAHSHAHSHGRGAGQRQYSQNFSHGSHSHSHSHSHSQYANQYQQGHGQTHQQQRKGHMRNESTILFPEWVQALAHVSSETIDHGHGDHHASLLFRDILITRCLIYEPIHHPLLNPGAWSADLGDPVTLREMLKLWDERQLTVELSPDIEPGTNSPPRTSIASGRMRGSDPFNMDAESDTGSTATLQMKPWQRSSMSEAHSPMQMSIQMLDSDVDTLDEPISRHSFAGESLGLTSSASRARARSDADGSGSGAGATGAFQGRQRGLSVTKSSPVAKRERSSTMLSMSYQAAGTSDNAFRGLKKFDLTETGKAVQKSTPVASPLLSRRRTLSSTGAIQSAAMKSLMRSTDTGTDEGSRQNSRDRDEEMLDTKRKFESLRSGIGIPDIKTDVTLDDISTGAESVTAASLILLDSKAAIDTKAMMLRAWSLLDIAKEVGMSKEHMSYVFDAVLTRARQDSTAQSTRFKLFTKNMSKNPPQLMMRYPPLEEASAVSSFLQKIISGTRQLAEDDMDALLDKCRESLENHLIRHNLVKILKNARSSGHDRSDVQQQGRGGGTVCQLPSVAFEALARLLATALQACTIHKDYLNAFALLTVSGMYFQVKEAEMGEPSSESEPFEFLSSTVCGYPIFQNPQLWRAVMNSRRSMKPDGGVNMGVSGGKSAVRQEALIYEAQNLLHLMHDVGVNSERALMFIQVISKDYQLSLNKFYDLQRFSGKLWTNQRDLLRSSEVTVGADGRKSSILGPNVVETAPVQTTPRGRNNVKMITTAVPSDSPPPATATQEQEQGQGHGQGQGQGQPAPNAPSVPPSSTHHTAAGTGTGTPPAGKPAGPKKGFFGGLFSTTRAANTPGNPVMKNASERGVPPSASKSAVVDLRQPGSRQGERSSRGQLETPGEERGSTSNKLEETDTPEVALIPLTIDRASGDSYTTVDAQEHWLVAGTASGDVVVTDLLSGKGCYRLKHSEAPNVPGARYDGVTHAKFLGNGSAIVSACSNGVVSVWDLPTDDASYNSREADATNRRSYFGGNRQATAAQSSSKRLLSTMKVHSAPVTAMICESAADIDLDDLDVDTSATSWFICSGDAKGGVVITQGSKDATAGVTTATPTPMSPMASLGQMAGASAAGTSAAVRNKSTPLQINAKSAVSCLTFASSTGPLPPPSSAAPTTKGKSADMMAGSKQSSFRNPQEEVAAFEPTSKALDFLAIGSQSGVVEVFDLASSQSVYHIKGHQSKVTSITPRRSFELVSCSTDRTIKLWDLRTKSSGLYIGERYLEERVIGIDEIRKSAYAPITSITIGGIDNSLIVSCAADGDIRVWDLRYDFTRPCQMLRGHTNAVTSVHWSVADNRLRSGSLDGSLRYWDTLDGRCTQTLPVFSHVGIASAVSTTSTASNLSREWVATLSVNGALKVFKTRQNQRRNSRNSISDTR